MNEWIRKWMNDWILMREYMIDKLVSLLMKLHFVLFQNPKTALPMKVLTTLIKVELFL